MIFRPVIKRVALPAYGLTRRFFMSPSRPQYLEALVVRLKILGAELHLTSSRNRRSLQYGVHSWGLRQAVPALCHESSVSVSVRMSQLEASAAPEPSLQSIVDIPGRVEFLLDLRAFKASDVERQFGFALAILRLLGQLPQGCHQTAFPAPVEDAFRGRGG